MNTDTATERQVSFIRGLLDERQVAPKDGKTVEQLKADAARLTKRQASGWIETLMALPRKPKEQQAGTDIPNVVPGHYALEDPSDPLNPIKFYRVNAGKAGGRWEGFIFVERYAGDERFPVKGHARIEVLRGIAADPLAAGIRYGREMGQCCICNRQLTRALSRYLGIGPVCGARLHEGFDEMASAARAEMVERGEDPDAELLPGPATVNRADLQLRLDAAIATYNEINNRLLQGQYRDVNEQDRLDTERGEASKVIRDLKAELEAQPSNLNYRIGE